MISDILISMEGVVTAHILVFQDKHVCLVKHGQSAGHLTGVYGIPGGRLEEHEDMLTAAMRELQEETGLAVRPEDVYPFPRNEYTADIQRKDGSTKTYTMTIFVAMDFSGELHTSGETTPEWISVEKLDDYQLLPNVKEAVDAAVAFLEEGYAE